MATSSVDVANVGKRIAIKTSNTEKANFANKI